MDLLQNAGVPVLKNPPWDSVISLQTAWPWKVPFSTKFLSSSMGPGIFFYKMTCHPKLKWALDLFTRWPHYKMTHSGLKATHFVWEIRRRILFPSLSFLVYLLCTMFKSIDFKKNALRYKNPWTRSLGSIYLQNVLLDPILSLITKCRAQGFGKCITSSTRNYDIRFPLYKKVCVRNVPHKKMGLLQKGVFCNGLEASHLVGDILRGMEVLCIYYFLSCSIDLSFLRGSPTSTA